MNEPIKFFAAGEPKGQPRPRAFACKIGGKFQARVYESGTAEFWKSQIAAAAKPFIPEQPILGPVTCNLLFYFPRPKAHYRTGRNANELRPDAPLWCDKKPDVDNAFKAVLDALTLLGFWRDDAQVCEGWIRKRYATVEIGNGSGVSGCWIEIQPLPCENEIDGAPAS